MDAISKVWDHIPWTVHAAEPVVFPAPNKSDMLLPISQTASMTIRMPDLVFSNRNRKNENTMIDEHKMAMLAQILMVTFTASSSSSVPLHDKRLPNVSISAPIRSWRKANKSKLGLDRPDTGLQPGSSTHHRSFHFPVFVNTMCCMAVADSGDRILGFQAEAMVGARI